MTVALADGDPPFRSNTSASPSSIPGEDEEPFYPINCNYSFGFRNKNSCGTQRYVAQHVPKTLSQRPTAATRQHDDPNRSALPLMAPHSLSDNNEDEGFRAILTTPRHYHLG